MRKIIFVIVAYLFIFNAPVYSATAEFHDISNRDYYGAVIKEIGNAKKEILVAMYALYLKADAHENPALRLAQSLIDAYNKGVRVKVYLDNSPSSNNGNREAYKFFKSAGVYVKSITPSVKMHAKLIVIDEKVTIDGSANWTASAMQKNVESNEVIYSRDFAFSKLKIFQWLETICEDLNIEDDISKDIVLIPEIFITDARFAPRMVTHNDTVAYDLYLWLLYRRAQGEARVVIDYPMAAHELGVGSSYFQTLIYRPLMRLKRDYKLIDFTPGHHPVVAFKSLPGNVINLPYDYWRYGLNSELQLKEKFCYLIGLREQKIARPKPFWSRLKEELKKEYHITVNVLGEGLRGLERRDLLMIREARAEGEDFSNRTANEYTLKPLIAPKVKEELWRTLGAKEGDDNVLIARSLARDALGEENNINTVKEFIRFLKEYKLESIQKAVAIIKAYRRNNPLKNIRFFEGVLKNIDRGI